MYQSLSFRICHYSIHLRILQTLVPEAFYPCLNCSLNPFSWLAQLLHKKDIHSNHMWKTRKIPQATSLIERIKELSSGSVVKGNIIEYLSNDLSSSKAFKRANNFWKVLLRWWPFHYFWHWSSVIEVHAGDSHLQPLWQHYGNIAPKTCFCESLPSEEQRDREKECVGFYTFMIAPVVTFDARNDAGVLVTEEGTW